MDAYKGAMATDKEIMECAREGFHRLDRRFAKVNQIFEKSRYAGLVFRIQMLEQRLHRIERRLDLVEG